jgi:ribose/xylose/arabinose/galactoside ABC-type transport system permease subunit
MKLRKYIPTLLDNLIWVLLLGVVLFFSIVSEGFFALDNLKNILFNASVLGILVIGQAFTLVTGNFDLSQESTLGLAAIIGIWLVVPAGVPTYGLGVEWSPAIVIPLMLVIGVVVGWINGTLITRFKMNNFIVTLAMLIALRGAMMIVTEARTVFGAPPGFTWIADIKVGPVPLPVIIVLVAFAIAHIALQYTSFGRQLYAVGGNRDAARASGIPAERRIRQAYIISGVLAAFAGWSLAARLTNVIPNLGEGMIFEIVAASVIGGISLQGGRGTMIGAFGGVLLLSAINAGLNLMNVSPFWVETIRGAVILIAMFIDAQKVRYIAPVYMAETAEVVPSEPSTAVP